MVANALSIQNMSSLIYILGHITGKMEIMIFALKITTVIATVTAIAAHLKRIHQLQHPVLVVIPDGMNVGDIFQVKKCISK